MGLPLGQGVPAHQVVVEGLARIFFVGFSVREGFEVRDCKADLIMREKKQVGRRLEGGNRK